MNKTLHYIKLTLLLIFGFFLTIFMIKSFKVAFDKNINYSLSYHIISICILYVTYLVLDIYDTFKKRSYLYNTKHNIISIIAIVIILLLFIRTLYDPSFLSNVHNLKSYYGDISNYYFYYLFELNIAYIESNTLYIDIILGLLIVYRFINYKKSTK